jgi:hypothetical protein
MQQETPLTHAYFSDQNLTIIQNALRRQVFERTHTLISEQEPLEIQTIMRSIYFSHAKNLSCNVPQQIAELNALVVEYAVHNIAGTLQSQAHYAQTIDRSPMPMDRPKTVRDYSNRALEYHSHF